MKDWKAKDSQHNTTVDRPTTCQSGGEGGEDHKRQPVMDVWKRDKRNLWRSDADYHA